MNFFRGILFLVLIFILLKISDSIVGNLVIKKDALKNYWLLNKKNTSYDISFIGPSRVLNSIDCSVFEKNLNCKTINLGLSGVGYAEQYLLLKILINENKVKFKKTCIEVSYYNLINPDSSFSYPFHEYIYLPFIDKNYVFEIIKRNSKNKIKPYIWKYIPFAKYAEFNNFYTDIIRLNKDFPPGIGDFYFDENGSILLENKESVLEKKPHDYSNDKMDSTTIFYLERMIELLKENKTEVILFTAPVYSNKVKYSTKAIKNYKNILNHLILKHKIKYYDMEKTNLINNDIFFYDISHLNKLGAVLFSKTLSDSLAINI